MIQVEGLYKTYGKGYAVSNAGFTIEDGEVVGFLGVNGAGKSTIMNILTGCLSPTLGKVTVDGYDIVDEPVQAKRRIGYLPEIPPLYTDMTVKEYLGFIYDLKKVKLPKAPHIAEICNVVKIDNVKDRLIKNLSKGYRQRVGIAQALVGNPKVLILDEPTVGLDPRQIIEIRELITRLGKNHTVILSSHILSEIQQVCKRIIIINKGKVIADDSYDELTKKFADGKDLEIRVAGPEKEVFAQLSGIEGVTAVRSLGSAEKGTADFAVCYEGEGDIRRKVFERMADRNWPILSLTAGNNSLEQLFLRLVEQGAAEEEEPDVPEETPDNAEAPEIPDTPENTETGKTPENDNSEEA